MMAAMTDYPPGTGPPPRVFTEPEALEMIRASRFGILATVKRDGHPHLSNMIYRWDEANRTVLMSTTAPRIKVRHLKANPAAALHVAGRDFFSYVVAEGDAEVSEVSTSPGDATGQELLPLYEDVNDDNRAAFFRQMVTDQRLVIRLRVAKLYGMVIDLDDD
jgi:PPOX class probable F420-dependent enzyme